MLETTGSSTMHATSSERLDDDEPLTFALDMFDLIGPDVDNPQPESLSTAIMTNSIPNAGDSQAHEQRPSAGRHEPGEIQPAPTKQKQVHWQDDEFDEDAFATELEELEAWVQSGAVEIIPDD